MPTFLNNKYKKIYLSLVNSCKGRILDSCEYYEKHHIIPRSIDKRYVRSDWNIVHLTAREHLVAHKLLVKCLSGKNRGRMISALWMMVHDRKYDKALTSRQYEILRKQNQEVMSEKKSKEYNIFKEGKPITIINMRQYCILNNIPEGAMWNMLKGVSKSCKGHTLTERKPPSVGKDFNVLFQGSIIKVNNMKQFCIDRGLKYDTFSNVMRGKQNSHKGYSLV